MKMTESSGNVFADLGVDASEEKKADAELALELAHIADQARFMGFQEAAATILRGADRIAQLNGFLKPGQTIR